MPAGVLGSTTEVAEVAEVAGGGMTGCEDGDGMATDEVVATAVDEATSVEEAGAVVVVGAAVVVWSASLGPKGKHFSSRGALYSCRTMR